MGGCQSSDISPVAVIHHPAGRMEVVADWPTAASHVMAKNPGHYVAAVTSTTVGTRIASDGADTPPSVKLLKLLRTDDMLHAGRVYHLVSFEEVVKVFGSRRCVKLNKLQARRRQKSRDTGDNVPDQHSANSEVESGFGENVSIEGLLLQNSGFKRARKVRTWTPTLQSIEELAT